MDWRGAFPSVKKEQRREAAARKVAAVVSVTEVAALKAEVDELRADVVAALTLVTTSTGLQPDLDAVIARLSRG